ncbi:MAG: 3'-5' exonuclease, partial [Candidatus Nanohaloarchaea archaeon]
MGTTATVLDADYVIDDGPTVRLFCVDADGDPVIATDDTVHPYFYVVPDQDRVDEAREAVRNRTYEHNDDQVEPHAVEQVERTDGRDTVTALRVVLDLPPQVPSVREQVADLDLIAGTREFDIPFYKRYLIDSGIAPLTPVVLDGDREEGDPDRIVLDGPPGPAEAAVPDLSALAFDLEVVDDEIIMCSFAGEDYEKLLVTHDDGYDSDAVEPVQDEQALLDRFVAIVQERDPDIVLGYNTDEFDFDVLRDRAEHHDVALALGRTGERMTFQRRGRFAGAMLEGRIHLDLYAFVENVVSMGMQSDTLTLDAVAAELIGEEKDDVSWDEMKRAWREKDDMDMFASYALRDAEIAYDLGESLVPQILSLSRLTGLPPFDV